MELISIIIPVYNTGPYLVRCVNSIINQTYKNVEIIIVDDGSEEETASLCDRIAVKDPRIHIYHKKNEGVSIARNYGINIAKGSFIGFVDSDDWIDYDMFQSLYCKAIETNSDIVYCDAQTIWDNGRLELDTWTCFQNSITFNKQEITPAILIQMAGSVCRGLYRYESIKGCRFPQGLIFSEDRLFNLQVISVSKRISYVKQPFYFRFVRADSCVNSFHPDATHTIRRASELINSYVSENFGQEFLQVYEQQSLGLTLQCLYGVFASELSFVRKYQEVRKISSDEFLQSVVNKYRPSDIRLRLLRCKLYLPLYLLLWMHNITKN